MRLYQTIHTDHEVRQPALNPHALLLGLLPHGLLLCTTPPSCVPALLPRSATSMVGHTRPATPASALHLQFHSQRCIISCRVEM